VRLDFGRSHLLALLLAMIVVVPGYRLVPTSRSLAARRAAIHHVHRRGCRSRPISAAMCCPPVAARERRRLSGPDRSAEVDAPPPSGSPRLVAPWHEPTARSGLDSGQRLRC
jgi:hypothetical protein